MESPDASQSPEASHLRRGWTTGACATAAAVAAFYRLHGQESPDPVPITLPGGMRPAFALAMEETGEDFARAGVVKDAGDDPDITHGALVMAKIRKTLKGSAITFKAGLGVGVVTKPGLPLAVGEPAINPVPRRMMRENIGALAEIWGVPADIEIEISIENGEKLAEKTWNPRLGILGGLSVLGTTGIVVPYSCAAWISSIHRGIDVARAMGLTHLAGATGDTSEAAMQKIYALPEQALLDMGDFAGGLLKYLRKHPVPRLTLAGGFAKFAKLAAGQYDLHSGRSQVDRAFLAAELAAMGAGPALLAQIPEANTGLAILELAEAAGLPLGARVAELAAQSARNLLFDTQILVEVMVFDRQGQLKGRYQPPGF